MAHPPCDATTSIEVPDRASQLGPEIRHRPGSACAVHFLPTKFDGSPVLSAQPWYREGLRFECTRCGNCCGGGPGTIRVSDAEIAALADRLGLPESEFRSRYTRRLRSHDVSLVEKDNYDCVFFERDRGCSVYEDRPKQCRTWPFWSSVVLSHETWDDEAEECPGMNSGPLHDPAEVERASSDDGTSGRRPQTAPR